MSHTSTPLHPPRPRQASELILRGAATGIRARKAEEFTESTAECLSKLSAQIPLKPGSREFSSLHDLKYFRFFSLLRNYGLSALYYCLVSSPSTSVDIAFPYYVIRKAARRPSLSCCFCRSLVDRFVGPW